MTRILLIGFCLLLLFLERELERLAEFGVGGFAFLLLLRRDVLFDFGCMLAFVRFAVGKGNPAALKVDRFDGDVERRADLYGFLFLLRDVAERQESGYSLGKVDKKTELGVLLHGSLHRGPGREPFFDAVPRIVCRVLE